jgi:hypothetical protein
VRRINLFDKSVSKERLVSQSDRVEVEGEVKVEV